MNQTSDVSARSPDPRTDESARGSKWFRGWAGYVKPFLLFFGILALILLAAGLHDVHFAEPRQFSSAEAENVSFSVASLVEEINNYLIRYFRGQFLVSIIDGALIGGAYASGQSPREIQNKIDIYLRSPEFQDSTLRSIGLTFSPPEKNFFKKTPSVILVWKCNG